MISQGQQGGGDHLHERKDANVFGLTMILGLLFSVIAICLLVCWGVLHLFNDEREARQASAPPPAAEQATNFPPPRLLVHPGSEREKMEKARRTQLDTYGWINQSHGVARIPIARAMKLIVERGLPEVGAGQTRLQLMQSRPQADGQPNESRISPTP